MNADRSNYALISALYADKKRGLYSDIYFPIIKYAILMLYGEAESSQPYFTSQQVHDKIKDLFHIDIPTVVIAMTVMKIKEYRNGNIVLEPMAKGNNFRVISADYDEDDAAYTEKQKEFDMHIIEIEGTFKRFMETEGTYDDGVKFIDFMADNTEALLEYFDTKQEQVVEEKYTTIVFFLEYLSQTNKELYKVANQLFWSSIIAAFLQSERPEVKGENMRNTEYFLDTSIVMGLLKLSTGERESCSKEVCDLIRSAGGQLKVHPLTIEEIKAILVSVETKGPYAYSSIADAYTRDGHNTNSIAKIRLDIVNAIEKLGVSVFPTPTSREKNEAFARYRGNDAIRQLCEMRLAGAENPYSTDNFREVHDIAMDDYVRERNKVRGAGGQTYFLTSNKELKDFCRDRHPNQDYMKSPGKVILELWMHSSKPSDISSSMLTETMARCMDLHRAKVRNKISEVSKKFKDTKDSFSKEVYEDFLKKLYSRAKNVITVVEGNPEDLTPENIRMAVTKDNQHFEAVNSKKSQENEVLSREVVSLKDESQEKSQKIGALSENLEQAKRINSEQQMTMEKTIAAKDRAERLVWLYARKEVLTRKNEELHRALAPMKKSRENHSSKHFAAILLIIGLLCIAANWAFYYWCNTTESIDYIFNPWVFTVVGGVAVLLSMIVGISEHFEFLFESKWNSKNPAYFLISNELHQNKSEIESIVTEIENATSGHSEGDIEEK